MYYIDILEIEHADGPFHQIHPASGAIEEDESGVRHDETERNPGQTHPRAHIHDLRRVGGKTSGEEERVTDMPIIDPLAFVGTDAAGLYRFGEQPIPIFLELGQSCDGEVTTRPLTASGPDLM